MSIGNTSVPCFAAHGVDPSRATHHPWTIRWWDIWAVGGAHLLLWNTSVCRHASHRVHRSWAVLHPLRRAVIEGNMWTVVGALLAIGNALVHHFAAHSINGSRAAHVSLPTVHRWYIGTVEGTRLPSSNTSVRHDTTLVINWSWAVHHPIPAVHGVVFGAGRRRHGKGGREQGEEQEVHHHHAAETQSS